MGVNRGLSIDGITYLADAVTGSAKPDWMKLGATIGQLTGNYTIADFATGLAGLDGVIFQGKNWTIGGMAFDGILRTDHASHVRATQYPVQTGVTMTDHAIVEPAELTIDIMMTDTATDGLVSGAMQDSFIASAIGAALGPKAGKIAKTAMTVKNVISSVSSALDKAKSLTSQKTSLSSLLSELSTSGLVASPGARRSIEAWGNLKQMQLERQPLTVVTRLQEYENMIIEELSAPDDYMTLNALKCTVHLKQIIFANVAETKTSKRACVNQSTEGGQVPAKVQSGGVDSSIIVAGREAIGM